jgi:hypothetical protein
MAVSIDQLFSTFHLNYTKPVKWKDDFQANYNGVYVIARTHDPYTKSSDNRDIKISNEAFTSWRNEAQNIQIDNSEHFEIDELTEYLSQFWNPQENILYIGQSSSKTNPIRKRVKQFYTHKLGKKGPHTGGYWLKLLDCLPNTFVFYAEAKNPRDTEFKMLMKFIELSSGKSFYDLENIGRHLPFANLTADFVKKHAIKNPTNRNKKKT